MTESPGPPRNASRRPCACTLGHEPRLVVVTGGPGAGKTAVLEVVQRHFCEHVHVLPESASILFSGGFPRSSSHAGRAAAQRAIFHVQRELESLALSDVNAAVALCDRGTLDGLAYWPGTEDSFFTELSTTKATEQARYFAVVHLQTPSTHDGYNHTNPLRIESARQARAIDERISKAWEEHPRRVFVPSAKDFISKTATAISAIAAEVPPCCAPKEGVHL